MWPLPSVSCRFNRSDRGQHAKAFVFDCASLLLCTTSTPGSCMQVSLENQLKKVSSCTLLLIDDVPRDTMLRKAAALAETDALEQMLREARQLLDMSQQAGSGLQRVCSDQARDENANDYVQITWPVFCLAKPHVAWLWLPRFLQALELAGGVHFIIALLRDSAAQQVQGLQGPSESAFAVEQRPVMQAALEALRRAQDDIYRRLELVTVGEPGPPLHELRPLLSAAATLAPLLQEHLRHQAEADRVAASQAAAARSCAYLRCANLGGEGGPAAGQGVGSQRCR